MMSAAGQKQLEAPETRSLVQIKADKEREEKLAAKGKRKAGAADAGEGDGEGSRKKAATGSASDKTQLNGVTEADLEEYRKHRELRFDDPLAQVNKDELLPL